MQPIHGESMTQGLQDTRLEAGRTLCFLQFLTVSFTIVYETSPKSPSHKQTVQECILINSVIIQKCKFQKLCWIFLKLKST